MDRPKIEIDLDAADWLIEIIGFLLMVALIGCPIYYFHELPDIIPRHFNAIGEPDGFSQKSIIWTLPSIGGLIYIGMLILNRYPHIFNYPKEITIENAKRQYTIATKLIRTLKMLIVAGFFYMLYGTIQASLSVDQGLGSYFLLNYIIIIFGTIGMYLYAAIRKEPTET